MNTNPDFNVKASILSYANSADMRRSMTEAHESLAQHLNPLAEQFYNFLLDTMPFRSAPLSVWDEEGYIIDFCEYDLSLPDPEVPNHFAYMAGDEEGDESFFYVPYTFVENPTEYITKKNAEIQEAKARVSEAYHKLAPRVKELYPETHPHIHSINPDNTALVFIVDGDNTGINLNDPRGDILVANVFTFDMATGTIREARMM